MTKDNKTNGRVIETGRFRVDYTKPGDTDNDGVLWIEVTGRGVVVVERLDNGGIEARIYPMENANAPRAVASVNGEALTKRGDRQ